MNIIVVGATSLLGSEVLSALENEGLTKNVRCVAFGESDDLECSFGGEQLALETFEEVEFESSDLVVLAGLEGVDAYDNWQAQLASARVIDCTNSYMELPLWSSGDLGNGCRIVHTNAHHLSYLLAPLADIEPIEHLNIVTLESVASAGQSAVEELWQQGLAIFNSTEVPNDVFPFQLAFSFFPQVGMQLESGLSSVEEVTATQLAELLAIARSKISLSMVRVPAYFSSGHCVTLTLQGSVSVDRYAKVLGDLAKVDYTPAGAVVDSPLSVTQTTNLQVAKLHQSAHNVVSFWGVGDNIRWIAEAVSSVVKNSFKIDG